MDYYHGSGQSMSSRGRFSSRGGSSYRGGGRGESSYRGSRGGGSYSSTRGYSNSRGRGSYHPKYETSTSKYGSDSGSSRYTSHARMEETSYRKPEPSYTSSRDHSHHRSDVDVPRKRIRTDSYSQSQGSTGGRRSHEIEDYRGSSDGGSRYPTSNSYTESRSYTENRGIFKKPRLTDFKSKEEYGRGRNKELPRTSGPPVSKIRSTSFRGRYVRGRAVLRRSADSFLTKKRPTFSGSSSSKAASELLAMRRKMLRLRRFHERPLKLKPNGDEKKKEGKMTGTSTGTAGSDSADLETTVDMENGENEPGNDKEDFGEKREAEEKKEKPKPKKEDGEICEGENDYKEKEKPKKTEDRPDWRDHFRKPFMKLQCPQCSMKCITFKQYSLHLYHPTHAKAMREKSQQLKETLASMRIDQRAKQKKMDEDDLTNMSTKSTFCFICKLNYFQEKNVHQASEAHKKLKSFLQPYCTVCRLPFKSAMSYERHICSLDHMRKKNILDERLGKTKNTGMEYLDNFMVLDSVGSGDELEESKDEKVEEESKREKTEKVAEVVGEEFVHKIEALYCEVCRTYMSLTPDESTAIKLHCRKRSHVQCFVRFGTAELLKEVQGKKSKVVDGEKAEVKNEVKVETMGKESENHEEGGEDEDKLWADVTDLLSQVEPEVKSDDEDEEESGRFDRFRSNEKKENGEVNTSEEGIREKESGIESAEGAVKQEAEVA